MIVTFFSMQSLILAFRVAPLQAAGSQKFERCTLYHGIKVPRHKYFAERASICLGHFWGVPGQNSWLLVGNNKILTILRKSIGVERDFFYLHLKNENVQQKT